MSGFLQRVDTKNGDTVVVVYFDDISTTKSCATFKALRTSNVANQKPAPISVIDYYDNSE